MYVPAHFATTDNEAWEIIDQAGAGNLVVQGASGLESVFVPVIVDRGEGLIRTHLARANPWWRVWQNGDDVLGIFMTADAYVTPAWYPSRLENPSVVPTWNYVSAEVRGTLQLRDDQEWLWRQVHDLTRHFEAPLGTPWSIESAPEVSLRKLTRAIVGVEISVATVTGKKKLSQNRSDEDRVSVRSRLLKGGPREVNTGSSMPPT